MKLRWINQPLASRVENVNPFNMIEIEGITFESRCRCMDKNYKCLNTRVVVGRPIVLQHNTRIPRKNDVIRRRRRGWFRRLLFGRRGGGTRPHPGLDIGGFFPREHSRYRALVQSYIETIQGPITADTHIRSRNVAFDASPIKTFTKTLCIL